MVFLLFNIGQPPPKRRLLDEFDRTVDSSKGSALQPVKSCPNGKSLAL